MYGGQDMHGVIRQPEVAETLVKSTRLVEVRPEYIILNYYYYILLLLLYIILPPW